MQPKLFVIPPVDAQLVIVAHGPSVLTGVHTAQSQQLEARGFLLADRDRGDLLEHGGGAVIILLRQIAIAQGLGNRGIVGLEHEGLPIHGDGLSGFPEALQHIGRGDLEPHVAGQHSLLRFEQTDRIVVPTQLGVRLHHGNDVVDVHRLEVHGPRC